MGQSYNYNSDKWQRGHIYPSRIIDNNIDLSRAEVASFIGGAEVTVNVPSSFASQCDSRRGVRFAKITGTIFIGVLCGPGGGPISIYRLDPPGQFCGGVYNPRQITSGPDGALWFVAQGNAAVPASVGRITTAGLISFFSIPCRFPTEIAAGPDGVLWVACSDGGSPGSIVRMTTSGTTSSYSAPNLDPGDITTGPDGALWFLNGPHSIGRITTSGVISTFVNPGIDESTAITAGPDGALWFTNLGQYSGSHMVGQGIGRITTSGIVTDYTDPSIAGPVDIAAGPDGALWFTDGSTVSPSIGRITTAGAVTRYPVTGFLSGPFAIAAGPDGALWFTNYAYPYIGSSTGSIGRITTSGAITDYTATGVYAPYDITAGSDGALWFVNLINDSVGRIAIPLQLNDRVDYYRAWPGA